METKKAHYKNEIDSWEDKDNIKSSSTFLSV